MAKPEIRLKGFEGEWKKHSLKEKEFTIIAGGDIDRSLIKDKGKYPVIANALSNEGVVGYYDNYYRIKAPAVSVTGRGEIGYAKARKTSFTPVVRLLSIESFHDVDFLATAINCHKTIQESTGVPQLTTEKIAQYEIAFPKDIEEEKAIGYYILSIDTYIQSTTKKMESLKQMKQACLVSMFPQAGETTPRVRFKGFEGEWLHVELSECLSVCKDRNTSESYNKNDVLSVSDDFGVVNQIELLGRSYAGKSVANYRILRKGDIVYTKSPLKVKPFGIIKVNNGKDGIVSTLYAVYTPMDWVSSEYISYYFEPSFRMNKYIHPLVNKGAKNDMKVSDENVLKGKIYIPKDIAEQEKIASFFTSLDKQISLQEKRLEKLKQIKAACLDKMFV